MIDWLFDHQEQIGVVFLLICVSAYLWLRRAKKKPLNEKIISPLIVAAFSGYSIPQGFFLLYCSFDLTKLKKMEDLRLFLAVASLSAILVGTISAFKSVSEAEK